MLQQQGLMADPRVGQRFPERDLWSRLFVEWAGTLSDYVATRPGDLPYWHNEWATAGFLAAAVWRMRGVTLQEGSYKPGEVRNGDRFPKRCDLWFALRRSRDASTYSVEFKQLWPGVASRTWVDKVKAELEKAMGQLQRMGASDRGRHGVAVCFVTPEFGHESETSASNDAQRMFELLSTEFAGDDQAFAAYRPSGPVSTYWEEGGKFYPGVALVAQSAWIREGGGV